MTVEQVGQEHILGTFVTQNIQPDKHKHLVSNKELDVGTEKQLVILINACQIFIVSWELYQVIRTTSDPTQLLSCLGLIIMRLDLRRLETVRMSGTCKD